MDAFDQFWEWANKPLDSHLTIPWEIHQAVRNLPREDRRNRGKVNEAVRKLKAQPSTADVETKR